MSWYKRIMIILLPVLIIVPCGVKAKNDQPAQEDFFKANRAYKNDQFQEAADGYLTLIEKGIEKPLLVSSSDSIK